MKTIIRLEQFEAIKFYRKDMLICMQSNISIDNKVVDIEIEKVVDGIYDARIGNANLWFDRYEVEDLLKESEVKK